MPKKQCPECKKGIENNPAHFTGTPVTPQAVARCVIYDGVALGVAIQMIGHLNWPKHMRYDLPKGIFDPREIARITALLKMRSLYDFLYRTKGLDDLNITVQFRTFGYDKPMLLPAFVGFKSGSMFTRDSINKFIAHLTNERITKPKCVPQPKFARGDEAIITNSRLIIRDLNEVITTLENHREFHGLNDWGKAYLQGLRKIISRLK